MSIKFKCVNDTLHIEVAACDRFSCQILLPTPYADNPKQDSDQLLAWARKMALQVTQSNSAWGVYHPYSAEEVAGCILDAVAKNEHIDEDPKQVRRQPNTKVDYNTWERNFRAAMEGV